MKASQPSISIFLFAIISLVFSCAPKQQEQETEKSPEASAGLPPMSNDSLIRLYNVTEKVDIIFFNLPISVNQEDAASARNTVTYVTPGPAIMNAGCKPIARLTWMAQGVIYKEADVYSSTGCNYLVFMEKNQPVAVNAMSDAGVQFFQNIISQVKNQTK